MRCFQLDAEKMMENSKQSRPMDKVNLGAGKDDDDEWLC